MGIARGRFRALFALRSALYGAAALGLAVRLAQYLANTSLSVDEALLALNIRHRSLSGLGETLDFNQAAPYGFLALEKLASILFGSSEYALRLFPFVASVASVVLFPLLARRILDQWSTIVATILFALSSGVVDYSATAKQYAVDVFAAVLLSWLGLRANVTGARKDLGVLAVVGAGAVWFSHAAALVLFAIGVVLIAKASARRDVRRAGETVAVFAICLASFGGVYLLTAPNLRHIQESLRASNAFVGSQSSGSLHSYRGIFRYVVGVPHLHAAGDDLGYYAAAIAAILCAVGVVFLLLRDRASALVLYLPVVVEAIASALGKYPLLERTTLFAAPAAAIGVAAGARTLVRTRYRFVTAIAVVAVAIVSVAIGAGGAPRLVQPHKTEEMKPVLRYLAREERPSDTIYLYYKSQYSFRYYLECGCFDGATSTLRARGVWPLTRYVGGPAQWAPALESRPPRFLVGRSGGRDHAYVADLRPLAQRARVWIVMSGLPNDERAALLRRTDRLARRLAAFRSSGDESSAAAYLYDFRGR